MIKHFEKLLNSHLLKSGSGTFYFALVTMILLPIYHWYLPPFMIAWGVFWILEFRTKIPEIKKISAKSKFLFILFLLLFVWQIIGMLYSDNSKDGWRNIVLRLSLFVFPVVLILPGEKIKNRITFLLQTFTLSTFLFLLICLGYALFRSISIQDGVLVFIPNPAEYPWLNYFYGYELAIFQHASYLSMYILFSVFIAIEAYFDNTIKKKNRTFWLILSIVLFISIYLLSSRAEILAAVISVPVYLIYKLWKFGRKLYFILLLTVCFIILIPFTISNPRFRYYFNNESKIEITNKFSDESRITIWKAAIQIIGNNVLFGVGTGDIQTELNKEYERTGDKNILPENNLNAHNQFLEILLENGLIGLLIFLSVFGIMFYIAISEKNLLYIIFLIIIFISFLFETMLNRLAGVSFFSLFSFLLIYNNSDRNKILNKPLK